MDSTRSMGAPHLSCRFPDQPTGQLFARVASLNLPLPSAEALLNELSVGKSTGTVSSSEGGAPQYDPERCAAKRREAIAQWRVDSVTHDGGVPLSLVHMGEDEDACCDALAVLRDKLTHKHQGSSDSVSLQVSDSADPALADAVLVGEAPQNIVMLVVGTRGDVQPFVGIGLRLQALGHRVRLASHTVYREFVEDCGLEFFPLGGDPRVLSEFVVKHRGVNPGLSLPDLVEQRKQVRLIIESTWLACTGPDPGAVPGTTVPGPPFTADIIVTNPPSYGHIHCAEKLQIPMHVVFTMPWTPTEAFPQPFARVMGTSTRYKKHGVMTNSMNWFSYFAMEDLTWMGLRDIIRSFRVKTLGLRGFGWYTNSHGLYHSKVPFTYCWSPSLVARPKDWRGHIKVVGFATINVEALTKFTPPDNLVAFLAAGPPPVYIGFGSLVMSNPKKLTAQVITAIQECGVRAIIQQGWGGLGEGLHGENAPPGIFILQNNIAHDWLFPRCQAVVHHGGAGTTATGLYAAKPTFIVTFFGDQPFWGAACAAAGVGPDCVSIDELTSKKLSEALHFMLQPACQHAAHAIAAKMNAEDGCGGAADHICQTMRDSKMPGYKLRYVRKGLPGRVVPDAGSDTDDEDNDEEEWVGMETEAPRPQSSGSGGAAGSALLNFIRLPRTVYVRTRSSLGIGPPVEPPANHSAPHRRRSSLVGEAPGSGSAPQHRRQRSSITGAEAAAAAAAGTLPPAPHTDPALMRASAPALAPRSPPIHHAHGGSAEHGSAPQIFHPAAGTTFDGNGGLAAAIAALGASAADDSGHASGSPGGGSPGGGAAVPAALAAGSRSQGSGSGSALRTVMTGVVRGFGGVARRSLKIVNPFGRRKGSGDSATTRLSSEVTEPRIGHTSSAPTRLGSSPMANGGSATFGAASVSATMRHPSAAAAAAAASVAAAGAARGDGGGGEGVQGAGGGVVPVVAAGTTAAATPAEGLRVPQVFPPLVLHG